MAGRGQFDVAMSGALSCFPCALVLLSELQPWALIVAITTPWTESKIDSPGYSTCRPHCEGADPSQERAQRLCTPAAGAHGEPGLSPERLPQRRARARRERGSLSAGGAGWARRGRAPCSRPGRLGPGSRGRVASRTMSPPGPSR